MGLTPGSLKNVSQFIQLAVAPIFLLTAVAATLTVFINRLTRIVDRGRWIEALEPAEQKQRHGELLVLGRRAKLIYRALTLGVFSAIFVVLLMGLAFAGEVIQLDAATPVALLFLAALLSYTAALLCLLREVFLAIGNFQLGINASPAP